MPGIRDGNLRRGDLAESLGALLMQCVALVAPVPRTEDVGIDLFGTLLRPETSRRLVPDTSFIVQLKSEGVQDIPFPTEDAVNWLVACEFPLFFGRVNLSESRIRLYPTHELIRNTLPNSAVQNAAMFVSFSSSNHIDIGGKTQTVHLTKPAMEWTLESGVDRAFQSEAFKIQANMSG